MIHQCPDEETLAAYFDGLLEPHHEAALHREMIQCAECTRLVAALGLVIETDNSTAWMQAQVPTAVTARAMDLWQIDSDPRLGKAVRLAAKWIGDQLAPLAEALTPLQPVTGTFRGAAAPNLDAPQDELRYHVTVGDLLLEIDLEVDGPAQVALTVRPLNPPPEGSLLRLTSDGQTRAMSSLTTDGAHIDALVCGIYTVTLERAGDSLGSLELTLETD